MANIAPSVVAQPRFARRAAVGFGLVTLITAVATVGTALLAREESEKRERILETYADDLAEGFRAQLAAEKMVAIGRGYLLVSDPELFDRLGDTEQELDRALLALERPGLSDRERELLAAVRTSAAQYREIFDQIPIATSAEAGARRLSLFREQLAPRRRDLGMHLDQLVEHKRRIQVDARRGAHQMAERTFALTLVLCAVAVVFSVLLAWRFIQHLATIYRREQHTATRAQQASAAREELLGIVAHDLRNPLSAISMKAASIGRHADDPRAREQADSIRRVATGMDALIGTLLEAARLEAGRLSLSSRRCRVADLFAGAAETFSGLAEHQGSRLEVDPTPPELVFWGDPDRIAQVLSNLMGNALKFTSGGGTVRVRAVESGFHVRFEVRDTGPGIADQHLPRVFDRFWRAEGNGRKGTGLGLYIARGIIEAHRGRIWVESRIGSGSAFLFELPVAPPIARAGDDAAVGDPVHSLPAPDAGGRDDAIGKAGG